MKVPADPNDKHAATLHALFPTMVYQVNLGEQDGLNASLAAAAKEFQFESGSSRRSKHFAGEYHGKILLHQQAELRPFFELLAVHIGKYLTALGMKPELFEMQCLKSWFVICEPGSEDEDDAIIAHNHSGSQISWVYYVDVPDECPAIKFHAGRELPTAPFRSAFHYDWNDDRKSAVQTFNWWNSDTWSVHPKKGDLIMFPGHQLHSVDANQNSKSRISVAGDISLVLRPEHMNLEFGRTASEHWLTLPLTQPTDET